ncbi:unnamed protein product, partial [Choristocarpus tenellus]
DVFFDANVSAGIALRWVARSTKGLVVTDIIRGSAACKHGGISVGMILVGINQASLSGMSHGQTVQAMQRASLQPRVLTFAHPVEQPIQHSPRQEHQHDMLSSSTSLMRITPVEQPIQHSPRQEHQHDMLSSSTSLMCVTPHDYSTNSFRRMMNPTKLTDHLSNNTTVQMKNPNTTDSSGSDEDSVDESPWLLESNTLPTPPSSSHAQTLPLHFVGASDHSLFDRDHILGLKDRDIKFTESGKRPFTWQRYSSRSLGDVARDWRSDPYSTPARRRRLIHDVCKVIVRSYIAACIERVKEYRHEQDSAVKVQALLRGRRARQLFRTALADRRMQAGQVLQLAWWRCVAYRRVKDLREQWNSEMRMREILERKRIEDEEAIRLQKEENDTRAREKLHQWINLSAVVIQKNVRTLQVIIQTLDQECSRMFQRELAIHRSTARAASIIQGAVRCFAYRKKILKTGWAWRAGTRLQQAWCTANRSRTETAAAVTLQLALTRFLVAKRVASAHAEQYNNPKDDRHNLHTIEPAMVTVLQFQHHVQELEGVGTGGIQEGVVDSKQDMDIDFIQDKGEVILNGTVGSNNWQNGSFRPHVPPGMMAVRVRRGSEETSLTTPIVLTENNQEAKASTEGKEPGYDRGEVVQEATEQEQEGMGVLTLSRSTTEESRPFQAVQKFTVPDAPQFPYWEVTVQAQTSENRGTFKFQQGKTRSSYISPLHGADNMLTGAAVTTEQARAMEKPPPIRPESAKAPSLRAGLESARAITTRQSSTLSALAVEEKFIEDSQLSLSCGTCGVVYLVEAVDVKVSESTREEPPPELRYLCTSCGGTLERGREGHWRRRHRPSSAPAGGRCSHQMLPLPPGTMGAVTLANNAKRHGLQRRVEGKGDVNLMKKLRYAWCARRIQNSFRDFRHRQYLRSWAESEVR